MVKKKEPWLVWLESLDKAARDATGERLVSIVGKILSDLTSVPPPPSPAQQTEMAKAKEVKKRLNWSKMEAARSSRTLRPGPGANRLDPHQVDPGWTNARAGFPVSLRSSAWRLCGSRPILLPTHSCLGKAQPSNLGEHPPASKISLASSRS